MSVKKVLESALIVLTALVAVTKIVEQMDEQIELGNETEYLP